MAPTPTPTTPLTTPPTASAVPAPSLAAVGPVTVAWQAAGVVAVPALAGVPVVLAGYGQVQSCLEEGRVYLVLDYRADTSADASAEGSSARATPSYVEWWEPCTPTEPALAGLLVVSPCTAPRPATAPPPPCPATLAATVQALRTGR
jgi:hypothetical protein